MMKAIVYSGPGEKALVDVPKPHIEQPTDALIRITRSTICGTDLHILKGDVPEVKPGTVLGHEGVGIVEECGPSVTGVRPGDHVILTCINSCLHCDFCRRGMYSHCTVGGWELGHRINGTQAEYVRVPLADGSLLKIPEGMDEDALVLLSDIFPTGLECGVLNGQVQPGCTVAVIGAGPVGLAALITAQLFTPARLIALDLDPSRLEKARELGATDIINTRDGPARTCEAVKALTGGLGADTVIEAVGIPATFELAQVDSPPSDNWPRFIPLPCSPPMSQDLVAPGGHIANIGVHGKPVSLHLEHLWSHNIAIATRLVDTCSAPMLLRLVKAGKLNPACLITHRFELAQAMEAYDCFINASQTHALKVIIRSPGPR
ncbi:putative Alcohol dehydrogenase [Paratrimastix pyriformis]|uniref:Alcohol dehydrogenase n=1 Tax=Paratrimastix pyriformis TaxID=342808 RepID=A0ABQ8UTI9_9EUKA|nr:putative Alcohol dehydrogenase [Paratrimastix pyriformis]